MTSEPVIRLLNATELDRALGLSVSANWNQRLDDWRMLLTIAPNGSFAAIADRQIVGTAIAVDYGGFAWIAMMLVDPAFRGRGIGGRLLEAALQSVPPGRPVRLDATPGGRPLYQKYGFEDEGTLTQYVRNAGVRHASHGTKPDSLRRSAAADLLPIATRDLDVFGGDRRAVLEWMQLSSPEYAHVVPSDDGPIQYCFGRQGRLFDQIGPVVARADAVAVALVDAALAAAENRAVLLDVFDARKTLSDWLIAHGFSVQRPLFRMRRPGDASGGADASVGEFAILGPEFG